MECKPLKERFNVRYIKLKTLTNDMFIIIEFITKGP